MNLKEIINGHIADMAIIGKFKCIDTFKVEVWPSDNGYIPHVHITVYESKDGNIKFQTAVKLAKPEYFPHGGKYEDVFSAKQKKAFVKFMKERTPESRVVKSVTNYEYCCYLWNDNDSRRKIKVQYDEDDNPIIPNYTQL